MLKQFETDRTPSYCIPRRLSSTPHSLVAASFRADSTHRGGEINGREKMQPLSHRIAIEPPLAVHF
jgi:hypothetical protein